MQPLRTSLALRTVSRTRWPSLQAPKLQFRSYATSDKKPSAVANFYKTFTRPVLKVLLMATLTYQIAYVSWMKLEQDEIKGERTKEVADLEAKVDDLQKRQAEQKKS